MKSRENGEKENQNQTWTMTRWAELCATTMTRILWQKFTESAMPTSLIFMRWWLLVKLKVPIVLTNMPQISPDSFLTTQPMVTLNWMVSSHLQVLFPQVFISKAVCTRRHHLSGLFHHQMRWCHQWTIFQTCTQVKLERRQWAIFILVKLAKMRWTFIQRISTIPQLRPHPPPLLCQPHR